MAASVPRVCLGVIVGAKGIAGEVRIKSFTENPADIGAYGPVESEDGTKTWTLTVVGEAKGVVIARIKSVADRTQADDMKGVKFFVARAKLPKPDEGTYYQADLVGLKVVLTTAEELGTVVAVHNFGGGDIIEVGDGINETVMVPFTSAAIAEVNMKDGFIRVEPLPGLFDDGDDDQDGQDDEEGDDDQRNETTSVKRRG